MKQKLSLVLAAILFGVGLGGCSHPTPKALPLEYLNSKLLPSASDQVVVANKKILLFLKETPDTTALRKWVDAGVQGGEVTQIANALVSVAALQNGAESVREKGYNSDEERSYRTLFGVVYASIKREFRFDPKSKALKGRSLSTVQRLFRQSDWLINYQSDPVTMLSSAIPKKQQTLPAGSNPSAGVGVIWFERNIRAMEWGTTGRIVG